jgi:hypothetical protein
MPEVIMRRFEVGQHVVVVSRSERGWQVAVDETKESTWFMTEAEAWALGVQVSERLDRSGEADPAS